MSELLHLGRLLKKLPRTDRGFSFEAENYRGAAELRVFGAWAKALLWVIENQDKLLGALNAAPATGLVVTRKDITAWRDEWLAAYGPNDETACVTPFDKYLDTALQNGGVK